VPPSAPAIDVQALAYGALRKMGFRETEAKRALAVARSHVGPDAGLEETIRAALRAATDEAA
jgi:Holliday junction resolvasome RuvABC DNA-binding subunit